MRKIIEILKRIGLKIFMISQKVLLAGALFFLYFFVFGMFSLLAKLLERKKWEKDRLSTDSFWLKPALETPDTQSCFNQS